MFGFLCLGTTHRCSGVSPSRLRVPYVMPGIKLQSLCVRQILYPLCYHPSPKRKVFLNAFTQQPGKGKKVAQLPLWVQNKPQVRLHLPKIFLHIQAYQPGHLQGEQGCEDRKPKGAKAPILAKVRDSEILFMAPDLLLPSDSSRFLASFCQPENTGSKLVAQRIVVRPKSGHMPQTHTGPHSILVSAFSSSLCKQNSL